MEMEHCFWADEHEIWGVTYDDDEEIIGIGTIAKFTGEYAGYTVISSLSFVTNKRTHEDFERKWLHEPIKSIAFDLTEVLVAAGASFGLIQLLDLDETKGIAMEMMKQDKDRKLLAKVLVKGLQDFAMTEAYEQQDPWKVLILRQRCTSRRILYLKCRIVKRVVLLRVPIAIQDENRIAARKIDVNMVLHLKTQTDNHMEVMDAIKKVIMQRKSGKGELQYLHKNAGISGSIGLTAKPVVNFSGVVGNNTIALGAGISFDTTTRVLTKYNGGLSFTASYLIASLAL
ncbi:mitochondrial outer membrane protein porin of 36 kDa [Tanacetum coccineum]